MLHSSTKLILIYKNIYIDRGEIFVFFKTYQYRLQPYCIICLTIVISTVHN